MSVMVASRVQPAELPVAIRKMLATQCDGEWDRVTVHDGGVYTVHNNAAKAQRFIDSGGSSKGRTPGSLPADTGSSPVPSTPPPAPKQRTVKRSPAPAKKAPDPEVVALASLIGSKAPKPEPGVTVSTVVDVRSPEEELIYSGATGVPDWEALDVARTATKLQSVCANGLPESLRFSIKPDVLALYGMDFDLLEAAIRHPERVEIRPESMHKTKGYPILGFHRGDVLAVLGMRVPSEPAVIAAYATAKLMPDEHRHNGSAGGGGARKVAGLPSTARALVKALRLLGAELEDEGETTERTTEVRFHGQCVGRVTLVGASREQVRSDYQRTLRKITAISQRETAAASR